MTQEPKAPPSRRWDMTSQEQDMMDRFRRDFLDLLDGRLAKIEKLVLTAQLEPAHVALLSLESSSTMVGRAELSAAVRRLRSVLTSAGPAEIDGLLAQLLEQAETARRELGTVGS
ncbi:hypothetical protein [uncultured Friedmanniella sp.]|uniref:hypothetical protein n=1 Tax=uncultured Friedmanniella sp. TaxID=335381 RepID=UPI0035C9FCEF